MPNPRARFIRSVPPNDTPVRKGNHGMGLYST
jgi:hypothetical protein